MNSEVKIERFTAGDKKLSDIAFSIRRKVFVEEQKVDPDEEYDEFEDISIHYLLYYNSKPIATARWHNTEKGIKLGRFAMLKEFRGKGLGSVLLKRIMDELLPLGKTLYLNAQLPAMSYYERFGFKKKGNIFLEAGIEHYLMIYEKEDNMTKIRYAVPDDIERIVAFQMEMALETENLSLNRELLTEGVKSVFQDNSKGKYIVAEKNGDVVASMMITYEWSDWRNKTFLWIQSVYVLPEFRRSGVFREMYQFVKKTVESKSGYAGLRLYVAQDNTDAQAVYDKLGMDGEHYRMFEWIK